MEVISLTKKELTQLLESAAERGAARALKADRDTLKAEYINKEQALQILCISVRSLRRLVEAGHIRKNKIPGRKAVYYSREDIDAYITGKRVINNV